MKLLLEDRFAPITSSVGFFEAPMQEVCERFCAWQRSQPLSFGRVPVESVREAFPDVLLRLQPLKLHNGRTLFLATDSAWTAYFDNTRAGAQPEGPLSILCPRLRCRGLMVVCIPNTVTGEGRDERGQCGSVQFQLHELGGAVRTIFAVNDGDKWEFKAYGEVQPFEKPEYYAARRVRDRFTAEMLEEYCLALGVRYFDPAYYLPEGLLIGGRSWLPLGERGKSLAEVRRDLGIDS